MINGIHYQLFLKFGAKEHLESLQQGMLYMKEARYFRQLESSKGHHSLRTIRGIEASEIPSSNCTKNLAIAGMADPYDSCMIQRDAYLEIDGIKMPRPDFMSITNTLDEKTPIFCCTCLKKNDFTFNKDGNYYRLSTQYLNDIERMKTSFGNYVLIIPYPELFVSRIIASCNSKNLDCRFKEVQYVDYSRKDNYWKRLYQNNLSHFFIKDQSFRVQREFRILLSNFYTDEYKDFTVLNVPKGFGDFTKVTSIEKLNTLELYNVNS